MQVGLFQCFSFNSFVVRVRPSLNKLEHHSKVVKATMTRFQGKPEIIFLCFTFFTILSSCCHSSWYFNDAMHFTHNK